MLLPQESNTQQKAAPGDPRRGKPSPCMFLEHPPGTQVSPPSLSLLGRRPEPPASRLVHGELVSEASNGGVDEGRPAGLGGSQQVGRDSGEG